MRRMMNAGTKTSLEIQEPKDHRQARKSRNRRKKNNEVKRRWQRESSGSYDISDRIQNHIKEATMGKGHVHMLMG